MYIYLLTLSSEIDEIHNKLQYQTCFVVIKIYFIDSINEQEEPIDTSSNSFKSICHTHGTEKEMQCC